MWQRISARRSPSLSTPIRTHSWPRASMRSPHTARPPRMSNQLRSYSHVLQLALEPWALTRPMVATIAHVLAHHLGGRPLDLSTLERREPAALDVVLPTATAGATKAAGVAIVPL